MFRENRQSDRIDENTVGNVKQFSFVGNVLVIVVVIIIAIVVCGIAVWFGVSSLPANRVSRYMGTAERYLSEMNYEQAIIEFERLLEIDPMNEDAIIGLADAYAGIGNREKAIEVLNNGLELTGARKIERRLNTLQEQPASSGAENSTIISSQPTQSTNTSASQNTSSSPEPEMRDVHPESDYEDLVFIGNYGYTSVGGTYDDPFSGKDSFYAVKRVDGGVVELKESKYPVFVSNEGIITYYGYKTDETVQIVIETEQGKVISKTVIQGNTDQLYIGFGWCVDRIRRAFNECDFAFFEGDDCTYIFGKDGSVKNTKSFNISSVSYWAPYIEGVGTLTYVRGNGSDGYYYYLPDLDSIYKDELPLGITKNGIRLRKLTPGNKNYGSVVIYSYCNQDAEESIDGTVSPDETYYVLADFASGTVTDAYKNITTDDGKTFRAVDTLGNIIYIDSKGNKVSPPVSSTTKVTIQGKQYDIATTTELYLIKSNVTNEDVVQIGKLVNLTILGLYTNQISDITPLKGLKKLTVLDLQNNLIEDIKPLAELTSLENLYLDNNQISDLTPLSKLRNLTELYIYGNQIKDVSSLSHLTNLKKLYLHNNLINDITPLSGLTNLEELILERNQISDITSLVSLKKLTILYLSRNQLSDGDITWLKSQLPNCEIEF